MKASKAQQPAASPPPRKGNLRSHARTALPLWQWLTTMAIGLASADGAALGGSVTGPAKPAASPSLLDTGAFGIGQVAVNKGDAGPSSPSGGPVALVGSPALLPMDLEKCQSYLPVVPTGLTGNADPASSKAAKAYDECKSALAATPIAAPTKKQIGQAQSEALAAPEMQTYAAVQSYCPSDPVLITDSATGPTRHVAWGFIDLTSSADLEITTAVLTQGPGCATPDTVLWLTKCDDAQCNAGTVLAISDDYIRGSLASQVVHSAATPGLYRWVMHAYAPASCGSADVLAAIGGNSQTLATARPFGGLALTTTVAAEDVVLAGPNPAELVSAGQTPYRDAVLLVNSNTALTCTGGACGRFGFADDTTYGNATTTLPRWAAPADWHAGVARIVAGAYHAGTAAAPQLIRSRIMVDRRDAAAGGSWQCPLIVDADGDGLSAELEAALGSCDTRVAGLPAASEGIGVVGATCGDFADIVDGFLASPGDGTGGGGGGAPECAPGGGGGPKCWHAVDSDNDGLRDDVEAWAALGSCNGSPVGPYFTEPTCTLLTPLDTPSCPGGNCVIEDVSAWDGTAIDKYDVFIVGDPFECTAQDCVPGWHAALPDGGHVHRSSFLQSFAYESVWTAHAMNCFSGAPGPDGKCPDAPSQDLRYRARFHVFTPSTTYAMGDDSTGDELYGMSIDWVWFMRRFTGGVRWLRLARYELLGHYRGGATHSGRRVVAGNDQSVWSTIAAISHEAGHMLTIAHPHRPNDQCSPDCESSHSCEVCDPTDAYVCMTPVSCANSDVVNPLIPSLMSYHYTRRGVRDPTLPPPTANSPAFDGCSDAYLRFSKGLGLGMPEWDALETLPATDWRAKKLVNDLACFAPNAPSYEPCATCAGPNCALRAPFGFRTKRSPFCDSTNCYVNWDQSLDDIPATAPVSSDFTQGRYYPNNSLTCNADHPKDDDEWRRIIAAGKQGLGSVDHNENLIIYRDSFNAAAAVNSVPWGGLVTVSSHGGYYGAEVPYRANACALGSPGCQSDLCSTDADCFGNQLCSSSGTCGCSLDLDCASGQCDDATSACFNSGGATTCISNSDCNQADCVAAAGLASRCQGARDRLLAPPVTNIIAPRYVKGFRGIGFPDEVRVAPSPTQSPLDTIGADRHSFWLRLDVMFLGFAAGQTQQTIAASGAYQVWLENVAGQTVLKASAGGQTLTWPGQGVGQAIQQRSWYRIRVGYAKTAGTFFLRVQAWDTQVGWYDTDEAQLASGCLRRGASQNLAPHGSLVLGWNGTNETSRFAGFMDNAHLLNYLPGDGESATADCTEVP